MVCQEVSGSASWLSNDFGSASGLSGSASWLSDVDPDNQLADPDNPLADPDNSLADPKPKALWFMVYGLRSIRLSNHKKLKQNTNAAHTFYFCNAFFF